MVGLGRDQKPVDKPKRGGRRHQRDHQQGLVEVGRHDVHVAGFVHRAAHDVVAARRDVRDDARAFGLRFHVELHVVAHGQRVTRFQAFYLEFAPQPAAVQLPGVAVAHDVPRAGGFDHGAVQQGLGSKKQE